MRGVNGAFLVILRVGTGQREGTCGKRSRVMGKLEGLRVDLGDLSFYKEMGGVCLLT
jgi:hypothetical protein